MNSPDISIIILSWNVRDLLRTCLASLPLADPSIEILVVDAASTDGSADMVRSDFPEVRLIASAENLGYSRGNNLALCAAAGRYFFVLNPDTEIIGAALRQMLAFMDAHPDVAVLGPRLVLPDYTTQSTLRRFPTLPTGFFESTWLQPLAPRRWLDHYYARDLADDAVADVDWVVGAALFARRTAYQQVGGLDEGFFMYCEELDWCRRMKAAGWRVVYFPPACVMHHEAKSSEQVPAATHIRFNTSKVRYYRKYHGALAAEALRWFLLVNFAIQLGLESFKGLVGHKRQLRATRVAAYRQVLKSGLRG